MNRILYGLAIGAGYLMLAGCGSKDYTGEQRFPLSGTVTYDGQPVDWGSISFLPIGGGAQRVSGGVITAGKYEVPEPKGANAGQYRVEIRWGKATGRQVKAQDSEDLVDERVEGLPAKFHKDSDMTVEISKSQTVFDFDLKSGG